MTFHVDSEVGQLKQVILHRPGLELSRLTPSNVHDLLFDDVMWAQRAREEHDAFATKLRDKGVTVHYFADLLGRGAGGGRGEGVPEGPPHQRHAVRPGARQAPRRPRGRDPWARRWPSSSSAGSSSAT